MAGDIEQKSQEVVLCGLWVVPRSGVAGEGTEHGQQHYRFTLVLQVNGDGMGYGRTRQSPARWATRPSR